jgi:predicted DNA-binding transcriptional regulator AlpA
MSRAAPKLLNSKEVVEACNITSVSNLHSLVKRGRFPREAVQVNKHLFMWRSTDVDAWKRGKWTAAANDASCEPQAANEAAPPKAAAAPVVVGQSKKGSMAEAWMNIAIGFTINYIANLCIFPLFGFHISLEANFLMGVIYTGISLARSYVLRRWFNKLTLRKASHG